MPRADDRFVGVNIKEPLRDILVQAHEVTFRGGFPYAAGEEGIADEEVCDTVNLRCNRCTAWSVSAQNDDG